MFEQSISVATPAPPSQERAPVLVIGASFAGLATAFWMTRLGYRVTIVEIADGLRRGGTPVDIEGETVAILDRMGLLDAVRAKVLPPRGFEFKDADDATLGTLGHDDTALEAKLPERYEIHRDDLLAILFDAVDGTAEIMFGRSVERVEDGAEGVTVTFDDNSRRDFALVFGCDGNRSKTRRLVFGDEGSTYFMGGYFYLRVVPETGLVPANVTQVFSMPGRTAMLNGYHDRTDIALAFRTEGEIDYDYRDRAQLRRIIHDHFDGIGWKVSAMLAHVDAGDDFYFDRASQIRMPSWSNGHVALVGDAGYCLSPVAGMGGSMAIIGAGRLAEALQRNPGDHVTAFREYEDQLRPFVEDVQIRAATIGMSLMFPADEWELAQRDRKVLTGTVEL